MSNRIQLNKNKLKLTVVIFLGIIVVVAIIHNSGLNLKKTYFSDVINKQIHCADKKIKKSQINIEKIKGKFIVSNKYSEKDKELQKMRDEVQKSKQVIVDKEKGETEEIKKQTIETNGKLPREQARINETSFEKIQEDLGAAYSQVESAKEQQIISIMRLAVNKLEADPTYDSSADQVEAKDIYSKLDDDSKSRFKFAIFSNVDGESIKQLRQAFGL